MKRSLYSHIRRMTTAFCIGMACITLSLLALRLLAFGDIAAVPPDGESSAPSTESEAPEYAVGDDLFAYQINRKIYFAKPDATGNTLIRNPESNRYYISVNILLADTEDSVLFTGFIQPGESRDSARLDKQLEPGVYDCVAEISAFDPDTLEKLGSLAQDVALYIGEKP